MGCSFTTAHFYYFIRRNIWNLRHSIKFFVFWYLLLNDNETNAVKLGVQALLRSQMINDYNKWLDKDYAPIYARESFKNCWRQYHNLGANGVMDDIHEKFMALPTQKQMTQINTLNK